jgi:hypothetical protein
MTNRITKYQEGEISRLLDSKKTSEFLGMSIHWVKASRHKPELSGPPFLKIGRTVKYDIRDLNEWLETRKYRGTYEFSQTGGTK